MSTNIDFAFDLLDAVRGLASDDFNGLGILFYLRPPRLPVVSLGDQTLFNPSLPITGLQHIAGVLASISKVQSAWHDGFHLVDVEMRQLTHVSQFFAPPIEFLEASLHGGVPMGARYLAAVAGSRIETVACTGLLSKNSEPIVFCRGFRAIRRES